MSKINFMWNAFKRDQARNLGITVHEYEMLVEERGRKCREEKLKRMLAAMDRKNAAERERYYRKTAAKEGISYEDVVKRVKMKHFMAMAKNA